METRNEQAFKSPVNLWLPWDELDFTAQDQIRNVATHPDVVGPVAIMPDCHGGYGVPIGCVFSTQGSVIPNAVGVDIGCGMGVAQTWQQIDRDSMDEAFWLLWKAAVEKSIPTGFMSHDDADSHNILNTDLRATGLQKLMVSKAAHQLGTLGGGNHFLEAQVDADGMIYFMVHSGSRHLGWKIAEHYQRLAVEQSKQRGIGIRSDLASLLLDTQDGQDYLADMKWACAFAQVSRMLMLRAMVIAYVDLTGNHAVWSSVDTPHNYAELDATTNRVIHRKGATSALPGEQGIIPGSMGSASYLVTGLGNADANNSCSHGAGRRFGRKEAARQFSEADFVTALSKTFSTANMGYIDESPMAYKDIETVIERQSDLVSVEVVLAPIITIKAGGQE